MSQLAPRHLRPRKLSLSGRCENCKFAGATRNFDVYICGGQCIIVPAVEGALPYNLSNKERAEVEKIAVPWIKLLS